MFNKELLKFFKNDELASFVWEDKYKFGEEKTPIDSFKRHSKEIGHTESRRLVSIVDDFSKKATLLSNYGYLRYQLLLDRTGQEVRDYVEKLCNFDVLILGGGMQQGIGNHEFYSSLSNCFVIGTPFDSYPGINKKADEMTSLMKRRGGCGLELSTIRPCGAPVHNQSGWSSGPVLFAKKFSDTTKEVAQYGRRGALMLSCNVNHPNSIDFAREKQDRTKLTGANISLIANDKFMEAVAAEVDFMQCFPCDDSFYITDKEFSDLDFQNLEYNKLVTLDKKRFVQKIDAKKTWDEICLMAWTTAEPGLLFDGNWKRGGTDYCYPQYRPVTTNPCSEIPMQAYDACRLLAANMFTFVVNPFTPEAILDFDLIYSTFYEQMTTGDILVDLEFEYIQRIVEKIQAGDDPQELKDSELLIWDKVRKTAEMGRRCGCGFLGLGDMLAALNKPYFSPDIIKMVFKIKMKAELDATTDLAILYGSFDGFDAELENSYGNDMFERIKSEFPEQWSRMQKYGRRNVSWSTGAPTGTGSLMSQTTSGIEPLFEPFYTRRKKCISLSERVDYIDPADGQAFTEYAVFHPKFKVWILGLGKFTEESLLLLTKDELNELFKMSPWFGNCANDLNWKQRVKIQSLVQDYTTHAISSTINLPKDCEVDLIGKIYMESWKAGLKGNTVYRDGSRGGILVKEGDESKAIVDWKRPNRLPAVYHTLKFNRKTYSIIIGLNNHNPYEIFIVSGIDGLPENFYDDDIIHGELVKEDKDWYNFESETFLLKEIPDTENEEKLLSLMLSGLLSSNKPLTKIIKIIQKSKPIAGSFTHRLVKILSKYIPDGSATGSVCLSCGGELKFEGGCYICKDCGSSKC